MTCAALAAGLGVSAHGAPAAAQTLPGQTPLGSPNAVAPVTGTAQPTGTQIFNTGQNGCDGSDIPDAPARAFRDSSGEIHFFASSSVARAMLGTSFSNLKRDCTVIYRSGYSGNPADFDDADWLASFYAVGNDVVLALVHDEYRGFIFPGQCPSANTACDVTSIRGAVSQDGGNTFTSMPGGQYLVEAAPYQYGENGQTSFGYSNPTNVVKMGSYYYFMFWSVIPQVANHDGVCIARTDNLYDPGSWRSWDGSGFNVRSVDPYTTAIGNPAAQLCQPFSRTMMPSSPGSLVYMPSRNVYLLTMHLEAGDDYVSTTGTYVYTSGDLINWSAPQLLLADSAVPASQGGGGTQNYPSLIDPTSSDINFGTVGDAPLLFSETTGNGDISQYTLWARQVTFQ